MAFYPRIVVFLVLDATSRSVPSFYSFLNQLFLLGKCVVWSGLAFRIVLNGYVFVFLVDTLVFYCSYRNQSFLTIFFCGLPCTCFMSFPSFELLESYRRSYTYSCDISVIVSIVMLLFPNLRWVIQLVTGISRHLIQLGYH